jgi:hypothetical protein
MNASPAAEPGAAQSGDQASARPGDVQDLAESPWVIMSRDLTRTSRDMPSAVPGLTRAMSAFYPS